MKSRSKSFTLIELILVVGIVAVLAGAMIPFVISARVNTRVSQVLHTIETLRDACYKYHDDTGLNAYEYSDRSNSFHRGLSQDDGRRPGWDGPYLSRPLSGDDNPFGGMVRVWGGVWQNFDLDGDGTIDVPFGVNGNSVVFYGIDESISKKIDEHLDRGIPGNWKDTGRLRHLPNAGNLVIVLLVTNIQQSW